MMQVAPGQREIVIQKPANHLHLMTGKYDDPSMPVRSARGLYRASDLRSRDGSLVHYVWQGWNL